MAMISPWAAAMRRKAASRRDLCSSADMAATALMTSGPKELRDRRVSDTTARTVPTDGREPHIPDLVDRAHHVAIQGGPSPPGDLLGRGRRDRRHPEDVTDKGEPHQL